MSLSDIATELVEIHEELVRRGVHLRPSLIGHAHDLHALRDLRRGVFRTSEARIRVA
jgi:hypothetical protein